MKINNEKIITFGVIKIKLTINNLFITLTDLSGNVLLTKYSGLFKFKSYKRKTPYVASVVIRQLMLSIAKSNLKIKLFIIQFQGHQYHRGINWSIMKQLKKFKLKNVLSIQKRIKKIHNGVRLKKKRRV